MRGFHHYGGVPYHFDAWIGSLAVQTGITLLWTAIALVAMWLAAARAARLPWVAGAALLAAVVAEAARRRSFGQRHVTRIVSFIGVGVLMLVIGYVAPLPAKEVRHAVDSERIVRVHAACSRLPRSLAHALAAAEPAPYRYSAPITIDAVAPFVQIALPPAAYGHAEQDELRDLRIVDARGERVPFALLRAARDACTPASRCARRRSIRCRRGRRRPACGRRRSTSSSTATASASGATARPRPPCAARPRESGGWLIDSGESRAGEAPPRSLRLRWSGPAEFSAAYRLETSDDLRQWRSAGSGQVMALQSSSGALTQPVVGLPRFAGPLRSPGLGRAGDGAAADRRDRAGRRAPTASRSIRRAS